MSQLLDFSWTAVDTILRTERPHEENLLGFVSHIENDILFHFKPVPEATGIDLNSMNAKDLQKLVELLVMMDLTNPVTDLGMPPVIHCSLHMSTLRNIIRLFSVLPGLMTEESRASLLELVRRDGRYNGLNLLHYVCSDILWERHSSSIRLLVELESNPNARTSNGNGCGVLHLLSEQPESETRDGAARLLLELGAHLDMADEFGLTAADYWLRSNNQERNRLPDWLKEDVPLLKCLTSRVVRRQRLPHDESNTPAVLIPFVALH